MTKNTTGGGSGGDRSVRVAIAGLGNCASSLLQGIDYYAGVPAEEQEAWGLMHLDMGGYRPADIEVVAAFDTLKDNLKAVDVDLAENQYTLGRVLEFDAKTERFQGDEQANALLSRPYRKPFVVPEKV